MLILLALQVDQMVIHSASDPRPRSTLCGDYFYNYYTRGLDILFDGQVLSPQADFVFMLFLFLMYFYLLIETGLSSIVLVILEASWCLISLVKLMNCFYVSADSQDQEVHYAYKLSWSCRFQFVHKVQFYYPWF